MAIVDQLIDLPVQDLKRHFSSMGKKRGKYGPHDKRRRLSRDELKIFLRENGIKTRHQLREFSGEGEPTDYDYRLEFGSWTEAMKEIWPEERNPNKDRGFIIKAIIEFDLWSARKYREAYQKRPDLLPSFYFVKKEFGSWAIAKKLAMASSLKVVIAEYTRLKRNLGKTPTVEDCREAKINIDKAVEVFDNKRKLDEFVDMMEEVV